MEATEAYLLLLLSFSKVLKLAAIMFKVIHLEKKPIDQLNYNNIVTCAPSPASRSPSCLLWHTPVTIITCTCASLDSPGLHHFPDYLPYIGHSFWVLPQVSLFLFHVCAVLSNSYRYFFSVTVIDIFLLGL